LFVVACDEIAAAENFWPVADSPWQVGEAAEEAYFLQNKDEINKRLLVRSHAALLAFSLDRSADCLAPLP
jgi:hypothetical protein